MRVVVIKKRVVIIFLVIIVCVVALILWRNIPQNIDVEYKGIQYEASTKTNKEVNIKINGKLHNNVFKGKIVIDSLDFTKEYDMLPIIFDKNVMAGMGSLVYTTVVNGEPILQMVGTIKSIDNFSKLYITTSNIDNKDELIIAAPAHDLEGFNKIREGIGK